MPPTRSTLLPYRRSSDVWVGTDGGLNRFRDDKFTNYSKGEGLSDDTVYSIYEDREGSLWIGTERGGLNRLRDGKFVTYNPNRSEEHTSELQSLTNLVCRL